MKTDDFDYYLPEELIAQVPIKDRDASRLMVLDKETGNIKHEVFHNIIDYLDKDDVLVLNDTKVLPARLFGIKEDTKAHIEILLLKNIQDNDWECLVKPAKRVKEGTVISFGEGLLKAICIEERKEGIRVLRLMYEGVLYEILDKLGTMPLPPYIHEKLEDKDMDQTVYAREYGSAAAPTAGLHFTEKLLKQIEEKGIKIVHITLHVGLGTFRPVSVEDVTKHVMHKEHYIITKEAANTLNEIKENGGKIYAVGTTSVRTLETNLEKHSKFTAEVGDTSIFIYPGFKFKAIDGLITNFHLPKSTLVMLVSAFSSKENILNAYEEAVKQKYRFFSFGDAMLIK